jgi:serine/threonine protein kinase
MSIVDLSGKTIKVYKLEARLGEGAYGAVYRAFQPQVKREVAVKIILPQYADQPDFIRRFETEAQLVAQLEHLHIVPLYDYWRDPDGAYLVMRLMKGGSLEDALQKGGPWAPTDAARLVDQVASAVHAAHQQGVVHRDLKPANILLDEAGNAYLTDFGIAKEMAAEAGVTQTGAILGTPAYITPEQVQSQPVTPRTDIYALGVVVYELLTGQHPFPDTPTGELVVKHLSEPLPLVRERRPDLRAEVDEVIQRATAKDAEARFPDALALAAEFRRALQLELTLSEVAEGEIYNPYKGLRAFQEADADDFFGREVLTGQLLARLAEMGESNRFLAVVGPSGSGKSSAVRAGLLPALRKGALPGSDKWFILEMMPGAHPLEELEAALLRIAVNPPDSLLNQIREDVRGLLRAVKRALPSA